MRQSHYVKKGKTKAVPLKMLIKELFTPVDPDNQSSIEMLEKVAAIGIQADFDTYLTTEFTIRQSHYVKKAKTKAVPLKMLIKELSLRQTPTIKAAQRC